jgi:hypothetical protein
MLKLFTTANNEWSCMNNNVILYGVLVLFRNCLFVQSLLAGYSLIHLRKLVNMSFIFRKCGNTAIFTGSDVCEIININIDPKFADKTKQ